MKFYLLLTSISLSSTSSFLNAIYRYHPRESNLCDSKESTLPDSLDDAARIASESCLRFYKNNEAGPARCRVDFDTTAGDETYTRLKSSTEFMQKFVTYACCAFIPDVLEQRQREIQACVKAKNEFMNNDELSNEEREEISQILSLGGRRPDDKWEGGKARIYFPDEGSAALAKRDWVKPDAKSNFGVSFVPSCVEFTALNGLQGLNDNSDDMLVFYFCPEATESKNLEDVLYQSETSCQQLKLSIIVNPNLVDMGVTGFGLTGRLLRERLLDPLVQTYYLRSLSWGALTRSFPDGFTIWQEDENMDDGYKCIKVLNRLPTNPEVEDIYDLYNSKNEGGSPAGAGILNMIGDFVDGMTKL